MSSLADKNFAWEFFYEIILSKTLEQIEVDIIKKMVEIWLISLE